MSKAILYTQDIAELEGRSVQTIQNRFRRGEYGKKGVRGGGMNVPWTITKDEYSRRSGIPREELDARTP